MHMSDKISFLKSSGFRGLSGSVSSETEPVAMALGSETDLERAPAHAGAIACVKR